MPAAPRATSTTEPAPRRPPAAARVAGAIAALLDGTAPSAALRRSLPPGSPAVVRVAGADALHALLARRFVEAVVVSPGRLDSAVLRDLLHAHAGVPVVLYAAFRPEHAFMLGQWRRMGAAAVCVEGVEDAVAGELVLRHSRRTARLAALAAAARALRCETVLQRAVWTRLLLDVERPAQTAGLAREYDLTRETLSRQFAAGDAPNLKRAIDAARVLGVAQALASPACTPADAARQLRFTSASHLHATVRRITGRETAELPGLGLEGILRSFARGRTRSRA